MNDEERARAFDQAVQLLMQQYGMQFAAQIQVEQWGPKVECKPALIVRPIQGWQAPPADPPDEKPTEHSNGKPLLTDDEIQKALR